MGTNTSGLTPQQIKDIFEKARQNVRNNNSNGIDLLGVSPVYGEVNNAITSVGNLDIFGFGKITDFLSDKNNIINVIGLVSGLIISFIVISSIVANNTPQAKVLKYASRR